jgi:hypothetical protein
MGEIFSEPYGLLMPSWRRRVGLLAGCMAAGGLLAYALPATVAWWHAGAAMMILAALAGLSALWSP